MALQSAMRAGKEMQSALDAGVPAHMLPPPPPSNDEYDDRVQCPHCMRKFNAQAAERHIPKCSSIRAKPKMLRRGDGPGLAASSRPNRQYVL